MLHIHRLVLPFVLLVSACGTESDDAADHVPPRDPAGSYEIDPVTGETRATHEDDDGTVTTMLSGASVTPEFPEGFSLYPGATVVNVVLVEKPGGQLLSIDMESESRPASITAHYRAEAQAAGFAVDLEIDGGPGRVIAGQRPNGDTISLAASREDGKTSAQLTITRGFR